MKKVSLIILLAAGMAFTSCQKEYVCVCTHTDSGEKSYGDKMKAGPFTKEATQQGCENNDELSGGGLKDCHLEDA